MSSALEAATADENNPINLKRTKNQQHTTAIGHMTARELHVFLFGSSLDHCHLLPTATDSQFPSAVAPGGKRRRTENLRTNGTQNRLDLDLRLPLAFDRHGSGGVADERSKAAAKAAGAGGGGGDRGGWCLLQKFIAPAGSKNSTLR